MEGWGWGRGAGMEQLNTHLGFCSLLLFAVQAIEKERSVCLGKTLENNRIICNSSLRSDKFMAWCLPESVNDTLQVINIE